MGIREEVEELEARLQRVKDETARLARIEMQIANRPGPRKGLTLLLAVATLIGAFYGYRLARPSSGPPRVEQIQSPTPPADRDRAACDRGDAVACRQRAFARGGLDSELLLRACLLGDLETCCGLRDSWQPLKIPEGTLLDEVIRESADPTCAKTGRSGHVP